jgi:phospholipase/lecithinase/hemolysin
VRCIRLIFLFNFLFFTKILFAFSNLIILGDSLTDSGNYPQSTHLYDSRYDDIAQYSYIPATNPINTDEKTALTIEGRVFPYPLPSNPDYLLPMTALDKTSRHFRSVNWTHYLVRALFSNNHTIMPERMKGYGKNLYGKNISVNYAWWATVTSQGCYDDEYHLKQLDCHFNDIFKSSVGIEREKILIPGILTQVTLIKDDIKAKQIYTDTDTLYILYAGGNGLYQAQEEIKQGGAFHYLNGIHLFHGGGAQDISHAIEQLSTPPINAHHFLVINLYDLSFTPRMHRDTNLSLLTHVFTRLFNKQLENALNKTRTTHPNADIRLFDNNHFFSKWANADFFAKSLGKQCDHKNINSPYYQPEASPINCFIDKRHGYLFWNNSHPSTLLHALLAEELSYFLSS